MNDIFILAIVLLVVFIIQVFRVWGDKDHIRKTLEEKKARDIRIRWEPFDFDRGSFTYYVNYTNRRGRECSGVCKISLWNSSSTIYWEE